MTVLVQFVEPGAWTLYRRWPEAVQAPAVGDQVDLVRMSDSTDPDDEVVVTVDRRQWFDNGHGVICYVSSR